MSECKGCKHNKNSNSREGFAYCSQCDRAYAGEDRGYHADRYEKDKLQTFDTNITAMCTDVANRLEELENEKKEIRAKTIDEFAEKIQWEYLNSCGLKQREIDFLVAVSSMVAEQMKAGADNE